MSFIIKKWFYCFIILATFIGCKDLKEQLKSSYSIAEANSQKRNVLGDVLTFELKQVKEQPVDSVLWFLNREPISVQNNSFTFTSKDYRLGQHTLEVELFYNGESVVLDKSFTIFNNKKPKYYKYNIVRTLDHDPKAYTQGLEFYGDTLYESGGQFGLSFIRKYNPESGEVYKNKDLPNEIFAEGLTRIGDKILQLTWQNGFGYVYDLELNQLETFRFNNSKEGWGLAYSGEHLFKTDGTDKIWILDANNYAEQNYIEAVTDEIRLKSLNELEFIDGKLYANTYQKESIVIINPKNGAVEGLISLKGLKDKLGNKSNADVLNGIAYKASTHEIFVTGKNWDKLFVIEIIPVE